MRFYHTILMFFFALAFAACNGQPRPATPLETFRAYTQAIKKKDAAAMKNYLSKDSLEMAEDEAKAQKVSIDEIIKRETLFAEDQRTVEFRNEKVAGEKATLEVKDASGIWNQVNFVRENDAWKIDRKAYADDLEKQIDDDMKRQNEQLDKSRQ